MFKKLVARQFRKPSGLLGHCSAFFMKQHNQGYIEHVCELLDIQDDDRILEIGCGAGFAIRLIAAANASCTIDAIDFSPLMLKKARKNNAAAIKGNRVRLFQGEFGGYEFGSQMYSKIFAVNVLYFWNDLPIMFGKIHRMLKRDGRLVLFMAGPDRLKKISFAVDDVFNKYSIDQVKGALQGAGFSSVAYETAVNEGCETYFVTALR